MNRLKNKVAIVTGATQGIGETYAKSLATEGAKVMVSDLDDPSRVVEEIKASGGTAAREFGDQNIHVNAIVPGLTISEGVDNHPQLGVAREPTVASRIQKWKMMPEDLIGTLLFLASEDSDFLSGQSINVDGGRFCQ